MQKKALEAAYNAWGILTFDPNKDDIEQFVLKVEELAKKLGYNEDAQVMAVKSVLPRDMYGICMTYVMRQQDGLPTCELREWASHRARG